MSFTEKKSNTIVLIVSALVFFSSYTLADFSPEEKARPSPYLELTRKIMDMGLREGRAYDILQLITSVGPRLTGSSQAEEAVKLIHQEMHSLGFDRVHLEPTRVRHWIPGTVMEARIRSRIQGIQSLSICPIGGSIATPSVGITAEVLEVKSFDELHRLHEKAKGKIIFFNRAMDPTLLDTFRAYGGAAEQRVRGAAEAAKAGGVAALVRSLTTSLDDYPHTGLMRYDPKIPKVPAVCVSTLGANFLSDALNKDPSLTVNIKLDCQEFKPIISHNVIGQITGTEMPEEIVLVGGHLDSWFLGTGAHDDGAGCAQAVEALRLIKEMGLKPKRTIRAVMFMDEETGGTGGKDYAQSENRKQETHIAAIESDRGGFMPLGFGIGGGPQTVKHIQQWKALFEQIGMYWLRAGGGGVDIAPLAKQGTVLIGLVPECQRYFDFHHSGRDVLEAVHPRELELGAIAMAVLAYLIAQEGVS